MAGFLERLRGKGPQEDFPLADVVPKAAMGPYQHLGEDDEDEEPPSDNLGGSSATNGTSERPNPSGAILEPEKELPAWKLLLTSLSLFGVQVVWTVGVLPRLHSL